MTNYIMAACVSLICSGDLKICNTAGSEDRSDAEGDDEYEDEDYEGGDSDDDDESLLVEGVIALHESLPENAATSTELTRSSG